MTDQLYLHIEKLVPGFAVLEADIAPYTETRSVKKDEVLLKEEEICKEIYFVNKGCLYLYYEDGSGKQVIHFALENWWMTDYKTFADGKAAVHSIAALEDSVVTSISRKNYEELLTKFPQMALYFNQIHERAYGAALFKQKTFATTSKKDFYNYFKNTYPDFMDKMPDEIFASYMGVSLETLKQLQAESIS